MFWPQLRLTQEESKYCSKYEGEYNRYPVLRRIYPGELNLTSTLRQDQETLQISRRCRIMAMTGSGDISQMEVVFSDVSGEQYNMDWTPLSAFIMGASGFDPRTINYFNPVINTGASTGYLTGYMFNYWAFAPYVFEPNIVMAPNQTFNIMARPMDPTRTGPMHVDLCFHVYEFPGMPGSPQ